MRKVNKKLDSRYFMPIERKNGGTVKKNLVKSKCIKCGKFTIKPLNRLYCDDCKN